MCSCNKRSPSNAGIVCEHCEREISFLELYLNTLTKLIGQDIRRKCFYCEERNAILFPFYCSHFALCYGCAVIQKGKLTFLACPICHKRRNKSFHYVIGSDKI